MLCYFHIICEFQNVTIFGYDSVKRIDRLTDGSRKRDTPHKGRTYNGYCRRAKTHLYFPHFRPNRETLISDRRAKNQQRQSKIGVNQTKNADFSRFITICTCRLVYNKIRVYATVHGWASTKLQTVVVVVIGNYRRSTSTASTATHRQSGANLTINNYRSVQPVRCCALRRTVTARPT